MSAIFDITRKELRTAFDSPVAMLFLGVFLALNLLGFFTLSNFFARNISDARPLFDWLPLLLILLVSAITMRQWAEERKLGTLEILLTLPVPPWQLVVGKFLAGVSLVALALALTFPMPVLVSFVGDLDWGPVIGAYIGALLLGAAYVSLGLCVSANTDNQVVSLIITLVLGGALYFVGTEGFTAFFPNDLAELLRGLGTGSRFESVGRGVLDLRDLAYYAALCATFLFLNVYFLEGPRLDPVAGRSRRIAWQIGGALVIANAAAMTVWMAPVAALRVDLTESGEYTISEPTLKTLEGLEEPLYIEAFLSARTHPKLAPLASQLTDLLREYDLAAGGRVRVSVQDPNTDEELEVRIAEAYGIRSQGMQVRDRNAEGIVNAFFHVLVRYADKHEVLTLEELVEIDTSNEEPDVRLRNLEYDFTRAIRRVTQDFQTAEGLAAKLPAGSTLTLYVSPESLPPGYPETIERLRALSKGLADQSRGRLRFVEVDPSKDPQVALDLLDRLRIAPLAKDLYGQEMFWANVVLQAGDKVERLGPSANANEGDLERALEAALRRTAPGQLKTIGIYTDVPPPIEYDPKLDPAARPPQPKPDYAEIERMLSREYRVERPNLDDGEVPASIDVLLIGKTKTLSPKVQFAIDQFLMKGGAVIAMAGARKTDPEIKGLAVTDGDPDLRGLLKAWGVEVEPLLVLDTQNAPFPVPVPDKSGTGATLRTEYVPYPFFPDVRRDGLDGQSPAVVGLNNVTFAFGSPVRPTPEASGLTVRTLLSSSAQSWTSPDLSVAPDFQAFPGVGFAMGPSLSRQPLALTVTGPIPSAFRAIPSPLWSGADEQGDGTGRTVTEALPEARLVVLGSSEFVSDPMMVLSRGANGEVHRNNLQLLQNLVDWSLEDQDLLTIRSSGAFSRTIRPMTRDERLEAELITYFFVLFPLSIVGLIPIRRRASAVPLTLTGGPR